MFCRLCGSENIRQKYQINKYNPELVIFECQSCRFLFQELDKKKAYSFYDQGYYEGKNNYSYMDERQDEEACRIVWKKRFEKWENWDKTKSLKKNYLDVGCSFGGLMKAAQEKGYKAYGVEISEYSGDYAKKRFGNDAVLIGNIENIALPEDYYSIVSMIEVIEHLYDPKKAVQNIYNAMKNGALLVVQTADMDGLQSRIYGKKYHYYLPGHLSCFSRENLTKLLRSAGFSRIRFFGGVEFGLLPKLMKSAYGFKKWTDYLKWFKISMYHLMSRIAWGRIHLTSSMVMTAWK